MVKKTTLARYSVKVGDPEEQSDYTVFYFDENLKSVAYQYHTPEFSFDKRVYAEPRQWTEQDLLDAGNIEVLPETKSITGWRVPE